MGNIAVVLYAKENKPYGKGREKNKAEIKREQM